MNDASESQPSRWGIAWRLLVAIAMIASWAIPNSWWSGGDHSFGIFVAGLLIANVGVFGAVAGVVVEAFAVSRLWGAGTWGKARIAFLLSASAHLAAIMWFFVIR